MILLAARAGQSGRAAGEGGAVGVPRLAGWNRVVLGLLFYLLGLLVALIAVNVLLTRRIARDRREERARRPRPRDDAHG